MNKLALIFAAAMLGSVPASAEEVGIVRLPEPEYRDNIRWLHEKFKNAYSDDVRIRLVVTPAFNPVWSVAIKRTDRHYRVVYENPLLNLPNPGLIKPPVGEISCEAPIDTALAERLIGIWDRMLTNYFPRQPEDYGKGGVTHSFAVRSGKTEKRVDVASPKDNTPPGILAALGRSMAAYCTSSRYWAAAPLTWWNAKLLIERIGRLDTALKDTKPAKLEENQYYGAWSFPAEDHLDPLIPPREAAAEGDKLAVTEQILYREAFVPNVRVRVRLDILPGGGETMAFISENHGRYQLVSLRSSIPVGMIVFRIHRRDRPPEPPIDPHKVPVFRQAIDLSPALAKEIIADFKDAMVWAVPGPRGHSGFDGTSFYFSMEDTSGTYGGFTRSSDDLPVLDALEQVAYDMVLECEYTRDSLTDCKQPYAADLQHTVREMTKALRAKRQ